MKRLSVPVLAGAAIIAGCAASYEGRTANRLTDAGLSRPIANCMADSMVERLSTSQLKQLSRFGKDLGRDARELTIAEVTRRFTAIGDPEIVEVVTRAGLGCAISGA